MSIDSQILDPSTLDAAAKDLLVDELYATHAAIFDGVSKQDFRKYVVDSPAERTRIQVYRADGRVVGYLAAHTFVRTIEGERWVVFRAESGKLPDYRRGAEATLILAEILRACARYPRARKAYLGCFVHPSAYVALARVAPQVYPHWCEPTPAPIRRVMDTLAEAFEFDRSDAGHSGIRKVGWITREDASDVASWERRNCDMSRFFMATNPGYRGGDGLVILAPLSVGVAVEGGLRYLAQIARRAWARPTRRGPSAAEISVDPS